MAEPRSDGPGPPDLSSAHAGIPPETGHSAEPTTHLDRTLGIAFGIAALALPFILDALGAGYYLSLASRIVIYAIAATSLNLVLGYAGLVSFGHAAFVGLGAYTLVFLGNEQGVNVFLCVGIAGVVCAVVALPLAGMAFRLRGGYFAIGTWVVAEVFRLVVVQFREVGAGSGTSLRALAGTDAGFQPRIDATARRGVKDEPRLRLAPLAGPQTLDGRGVGMDLHRQLLAGEQIFDQQIGGRVAGFLEPDLADRRCTGGGIVKAGPQRVASPGLLDTMGVKQGGGHQTFLLKAGGLARHSAPGPNWRDAGNVPSSTRHRARRIAPVNR